MESNPFQAIGLRNITQDEEKDLQYFQSVPWCAKILNNPAFVPVRTASRQIKPTTEDAIFAEVLKTENTVSACITVYRRPIGSKNRIEEIRTFLRLGYGLNGYPHIVHGGIQSLFLDEITGLLLSINKDLEAGPIRQAAVTASLLVTFIRPMKTPGVIMVTAKLKEVKGRKHYLEATAENENGIVLVKGEALYIAIDMPKERL